MNEQAEHLPAIPQGEIQIHAGGRSIAALERMAAETEERVKLIKRVHAIIDSQADQTCFDTIDGTVCRNINYARLVHRTIGGSWEWSKGPDGKPMVFRLDYEDTEGTYYVYEAFGVFTLPTGEHVEGAGMFSSRDKFLGKVRGEFKEQSAVDERSVRAAAMTEAYKKAIFAAMGYGKATMENMRQAGANVDTGRGYQHGKGTRGGNSDDDAQRVARDRIRKGCQFLFDAGWTAAGFPDPNGPDDVCRLITKSEKFDGWKVIDKISPNGLKVTLTQVKKAAKDFGLTAEGNAPTSPPEDAQDAPEADPKADAQEEPKEPRDEENDPLPF